MNWRKNWKIPMQAATKAPKTTPLASLIRTYFSSATSQRIGRRRKFARKEAFRKAHPGSEAQNIDRKLNAAKKRSMEKRNGEGRLRDRFVRPEASQARKRRGIATRIKAKSILEAGERANWKGSKRKIQKSAVSNILTKRSF